MGAASDGDDFDHALQCGEIIRIAGINRQVVGDGGPQDLYVNWTFAVNGRPGKGQGGAATLRPGQKISGELGGVWASGVDTNPPNLYVVAVLATDVGKSCSSSPW